MTDRERALALAALEQGITTNASRPVEALAAYADAVGLQPAPILTLEKVERQVREVLDDEIGWWLGERQREDLVGLIVAGLRQQMGGGQG